MLTIPQRDQTANSNYDITDFEKQVLERSKTVPVLVDFWAEWCQPCKMLSPALEGLAKRSEGKWELAKVNLDVPQLQQFANKYQVRSIPNVKLFIDGEDVDGFIGIVPEETIARWLQEKLPSEAKSAMENAAELLEARQYSKSRAILEPLLEQEPENEQALVMLAQTYLPSDLQKAVALVEGITELSSVADIAESIRVLAELHAKAADVDTLPDGPAKGEYVAALTGVASSDYDAALENFIEVVREDRYYDDDGARKACIAIFRLLGPAHQVTKKHRRIFDSALYV